MDEAAYCLLQETQTPKGIKPRRGASQHSPHGAGRPDPTKSKPGKDFGITVDTSFSRHRAPPPLLVYSKSLQQKNCEDDHSPHTNFDNVDGSVRFVAKPVVRTVKRSQTHRKPMWWPRRASKDAAHHGRPDVAEEPLTADDVVTTNKTPETSKDLTSGDRSVTIGLDILSLNPIPAPTADRVTFRMRNDNEAVQIVEPSEDIADRSSRSVKKLHPPPYRPRPASSVYSQTYSAKPPATIQPPELPALPSQYRQQAATYFGRTEPAISESSSIETAFEDEDTTGGLSDGNAGTTLEKDVSPSPELERSPEASGISVESYVSTPRRSKGWWNFIKSPFTPVFPPNVRRKTFISPTSGELADNDLTPEQHMLRSLDTPTASPVAQEGSHLGASRSLSHITQSVPNSGFARSTESCRNATNAMTPSAFAPSTKVRGSLKRPTQPRQRDSPSRATQAVLSGEPLSHPSDNTTPKKQVSPIRSPSISKIPLIVDRIMGSNRIPRHATAGEDPSAVPPCQIVNCQPILMENKDTGSKSIVKLTVDEGSSSRSDQTYSTPFIGIAAVGHMRAFRAVRANSVEIRNPCTMESSGGKQPLNIPMTPPYHVSQCNSNGTNWDVARRREENMYRFAARDDRRTQPAGHGSSSEHHPWSSCLGRRTYFGEKSSTTPKKRPWMLVACGGAVFVVVLIVVLVVTVPRKQKDMPAQSAWLNLTEYPAIPTGISTVAQPVNLVARSHCVQPSTMWSCALPKEDNLSVAPNKPNEPNFRFEIRFRNDTDIDSSMTERAPLPTRNLFSDMLYDSSPLPPSKEDQAFLGNVTDNITFPYDGERTPFFITLLPTTMRNNPTLGRRDEIGNIINETFPSLTAEIPKPRTLSNGDATPANLLPLLSAQPLRLYNRNQDTEHYGFYNYVDRSIFLNSVRPLNAPDVDFGKEPEDLHGGTALREASAKCTWAQTRLKIAIWTRAGASKQLLPRPFANTSGSSNFSATDFTRPGSFPYPVTVTLDRHGGAVEKKGIYCYGMKEGKVLIEDRKWHLEDRAAGGYSINPAEGPWGNVTVGSGGDWDGIDGGTGGCECSWGNWV